MPQVTRGEWLDPLNRLIWQRAIRKRMETVKLRNGSVFKVEYDARNTNGLIHVKPVVGFTPCGFWRLEEVLDPRWIHVTEMAPTAGEGVASGS